MTFDDLRVSHVYSPVTGRVIRIDANLGQRVKKGQPLAVIESPDIGSAVSDVAKADAELIAAEHDFKRKKELFDQHAASQADVETAEDNYRKAKAEKDRAMQKTVLIFQDRLVRQRLADLHARLADRRRGRDAVGEPRHRGAGAVLGRERGGALHHRRARSSVWVLADVYEMDLARVTVGAKVEVKVVSYPGKVFEGRVDWVTGMLDPTTRTARVRCSFPNTDGLLKPEMYATVQISVENRKALAIPRSSLLRLGDSTIVFVNVGKAPDGRERFTRMPVGVDEGEGSNWLVVQKGLEVGQKIVTAGAILLSGMI